MPAKGKSGSPLPMQAGALKTHISPCEGMGTVDEHKISLVSSLGGRRTWEEKHGVGRAWKWKDIMLDQGERKEIWSCITKASIINSRTGGEIGWAGDRPFGYSLLPPLSTLFFQRKSWGAAVCPHVAMQFATSCRRRILALWPEQVGNLQMHCSLHRRTTTYTYTIICSFFPIKCLRTWQGEIFWNIDCKWK